jgi:protein-tyrosine phosphatase
MTEITNVLFVCQGNIVRSPLAEHLFRLEVEKHGWGDLFRIDSAGTSAWHAGEAPDGRMRQVAAEHGITYSGRSRQVSATDLEDFDLVIAMDHENTRDLLRLASDKEAEQKIHLLREFDPQAEPNATVPDPYYGGQDGFEHVFQIVERATRELLRSLGSAQ